MLYKLILLIVNFLNLCGCYKITSLVPEQTCKQIDKDLYPDFSFRCNADDMTKRPELAMLWNVTAFSTCAQECRARAACSLFEMPEPPTFCRLLKSPGLGKASFRSNPNYSSGYKNNPEEKSCEEIGMREWEGYTLSCRRIDTNQGPLTGLFHNITSVSACARECNTTDTCASFEIFLPENGEVSCRLYDAPVQGRPKLTASTYSASGHKINAEHRSCEQLDPGTYGEYTIKCGNEVNNRGATLASFRNVTAFTACAEQCSTRRACASFSIFKPSVGEPDCGLYRAPGFGRPSFKPYPWDSSGYKNDPEEKSCDQIGDTSFREFTIQCTAILEGKGPLLETLADSMAFSRCADECSARSTCRSFELSKSSAGTPSFYRSVQGARLLPSQLKCPNVLTPL